MNPTRLIPTIEDDGFIGWESNSCVRYLEDRPYVAGETFTMGDISLSSRLHQWLNLGLEMPPFPNIKAWYERLRARFTFAKVFTFPLI